ncbi:hypothetical protein RIVM261_060980 [Rivularia sp. IAM M-261]|nr:hypothetical protein CAL7716_036560 [Calothrix sp. PCC 7716]GJD21142.1 hypothetical protein RIVM261_060980 [Rivularia sp. IAM M-261]
MKKITIITALALGCVATVSGLPTQIINPYSGQVQAQAMKDVTGLSISQKLDLLAKEKGQFGSGDALRRFFFGDLEPLGVQPGGAGMVVNLYNKANNMTFSYCSTYDVVVAMKKGKITNFPANEVK